MKYVNVEDLEKRLKQRLHIPDTSPEHTIFNRGIQTCLLEISKLDGIDVATGEWIPRLHASENDIFICSHCKKELSYNPSFCPNCGAKMDNAWKII